MQCTARLRLLKYNNDLRTVNICSGHFTCKKSNTNIFRDSFQHRSVLNIHFISRTSFPFGDQMKKKTRSKVSLASFASPEVFWKLLRSNWTHFGPFKRLLNHMAFIHSRCPNITLAREEFVFWEHLLLTYPSMGDVMIPRVSLSLRKCLSFVYPAIDYCGNVGKERLSTVGLSLIWTTPMQTLSGLLWITCQKKKQKLISCLVQPIKLRH